MAEWETRLSHRHLGWLVVEEYPWDEQVKQHPKYQQLKAEERRLLEEQRQLIAQLDEGDEL